MASGALEAYFGGDLSFGASSNAMVIDRELLELPLVPPKRSSPPDLYYVTSTAELIKQFLPDGEANLKHIATILRTNERTLQRKLAKFGVTFEHLVDITRRDEAIRLITQSSERMANVAFRLGYSEQANFNRAFRRWTGNQPRVYRRDNA
jgi:AraC-like DNA-binding protein